MNQHPTGSTGLASDKSGVRTREPVASERFMPYEDFSVQPEITSDTWVITLETHLLVHRKYTKRGVYFPHSVFSAFQSTNEPTDDFIDTWLPKAREAALKLINKGEYTDEELIGGELQSVTRKYNQWVFWDRRNRATAGEFQAVGLQLGDKVQANTKPKRKLAPWMTIWN